MRYLYYFFIVIFLFLQLSIKAGVNIKNGNFYISYTDHDLSGSNGFDITRTYNSKSSDKGLFGFGWGSVFETKLILIGDGMVVVKEFGSGSDIVFTTATQNEELLTQSVNLLVKAAIENNDIENNPVAINEFRRNMRSNMHDRHTKWMKYRRSGLLQDPVLLPEGTVWESQDMGYQQLEKTTSGYKRTNDDGSYDLFNHKGLLTGNFTGEGNPVFRLTYTIKQQIAALTDGAGNKFEFVFNPQGFVQSIKSRQGVSTYLYKNNTLIRSKDIANNIYRHEYDSAYNMTAIYYTDGTSMRIEYETVTFFCKKVTLPNGDATEYQYKNFYDEAGNISNLHYATLVLKTTKKTGKTDSSYFEYENKVKADGSVFIYRYLFIRNGKEFETISDEQCEMSNTLRIDKETFKYKYNENCITVSEESDSLLTEAIIDPQWNKASKLLFKNKLTGEVKTRLLTYNQAGKPVLIVEGVDSTIIKYTSDGRLSEIAGTQSRLVYSYNAEQVLQKITLNNTKEVLFVYNKQGELLRSESKQGKETVTIIESKRNELEKFIEITGIPFRDWDAYFK